MIVIPSLQLMGGKVVRLDDGSPDSKVVLAENPLQIARTFAQQGALFFQLIDLDAVFGLGDNLEVVTQFQDAMLPCQVGGGIRDADRARAVLEAGADRVLIGTLFQSDPDAAKHIVDEFGVRIVASVDLDADGFVRTHGWQEQGPDASSVWQQVTATGARTVVLRLTEQAEANNERIESFAARARDEQVSLYVDSGAETVDGLGGLSQTDGVDGLILGHAIYSSKLDIAPAIAAV